MLRAAHLLAEDDLSDDEIATSIHCARWTLSRWKRKRPFQDKIDEIRRKLGSLLHRREIARQSRRLAVMDRRYRKLQQIIEERGAADEMQAIPGGTTGLLVKTRKAIGSGASIEFVDEYELDTGLLAEMRQLEKQAAIELGQIEERSGGVGTIVTILNGVDLGAIVGDKPLLTHHETNGHA